MKDYTIRPAILHDILGITMLMQQLGYTNSLVEIKDRFNKYMNLDGYDIAVACNNHEILGWIAWSKSFYFVTEHTRFRVEGIVVDKKFNGHGIGKKLMAFLEDYAKSYTPVIIDLTSGTRREGVKEFYDKLGYKNEGKYEKIYLRKEFK